MCGIVTCPQGQPREQDVSSPSSPHPQELTGLRCSRSCRTGSSAGFPPGFQWPISQLTSVYFIVKAVKSSGPLKATTASYCFLLAFLWTPGGCLFASASVLPAAHIQQQWRGVRRDLAGVSAHAPRAFCTPGPSVVTVVNNIHLCHWESPGDPVCESSPWNAYVFNKRQHWLVYLTSI